MYIVEYQIQLKEIDVVIKHPQGNGVVVDDLVAARKYLHDVVDKVCDTRLIMIETQKLKEKREGEKQDPPPTTFGGRMGQN